ncbi:response regulator [Cereibacter sphaeroides]|uniref:response regulator n=1 Tax=Cereibacter sphaeroides TaxID=1063 RepID=UPI001F401C60|nr:response regulator [Cereibacter sphaeroides]MCE6949746.1 response regulator [Cereibacter sphaeroides]
MTLHSFAPPSAPGDASKAAATSEGVGAGRKPLARILVVEDEWLVACEIEAALEGEGWEVVGIAASADEAVRMAEVHRPDLVLMDIRIRGNRDGIHAALEISRRFGLRSLFVSANHDPGTRERAQAAYPLGWVPKPFSAPLLVSAVEEALRGLRP